MHSHLVSDATFVGRFRREAKAAARIVHPNTVKILDHGVDGELLYIAMELLAGQDLFETLVLERRLDEARAARILVEVADALVTAHERGVVHRDLKPENIMLLRDPADPSREDVKVLDFGIAKILDFDTPSLDGTGIHTALTGVGTVVGTPAYMSPEQCRGEPIDTRSDVYTCGILLYQLVSGRLPFTAENAMDLAVMHVRAPPAPLESVVPAVSPKLAAVVATALAKWPSQRQQSAAELRDSLRTVLPELSPTPLALAEGLPVQRPVHIKPPSRLHPPRTASKEPIPLPAPPPAPHDLLEDDESAAATADVSKAVAEVMAAARAARALKQTASEEQATAEPAREEKAPRERETEQGGEPRAAKKKPAPASPAAQKRASSPGGGGALAKRPPAAARPLTRPPPRLGSWYLVPLALILGVTLGTLAFLISHR